MAEYVDEVLDFIDFVENNNGDNDNNPVPHLYIRDVENPFEYYNEREFKKRYRFAKENIRDVLLPLVVNRLQNHNQRGLPISTTLQLLLCLRFYATGTFQMVQGDLCHINQATVSRIIKRVSICIAEQLERFIKFPRTDINARANITAFYRFAQFPSVSGCIDCTHIPIRNLGGNNADVYRNRKRVFSLNVQVVCGPRYEIMDIVARHPGSYHDATIFNRSAVKLKYERHEIHGLLLGDNGYACRQYMLTPVLNPQIPQEENYNAAHVRTRNIVERVFGMWKRRFPCLSRTFGTMLVTTSAVICATAVLYNIAILNGFKDVEGDAEDPEDLVDYSRQQDNEAGLAFRRRFIVQLC